MKKFIMVAIILLAISYYWADISKFIEGNSDTVNIR